MIVGRDKIIEVIQFNDSKKWSLKRTEKSAPIFKYEGDNTTEEAIASFNRVFELIEPGPYFLEVWSGDDKRYRMKTPFRKEGGTNGTSHAGMEGVQIGSVEDIGVMAVEKYLKEKHYVELEEKVKEQESMLNNFFVRMGLVLEPHLPDLIGAITKTINPSYVGNTKLKKQFSSKTNPMPKNNLNDEQITQKVSELFSIWFEKDPQALELIEKIVGLTESNPQMYEMAKKMLINS